MAVFLLHGIVEQYVHGVSAYRNFVPREAFEAYLRSRRVPFAGWSADGADGDVLTVDDATRAGADACMSARRLGHEVMFFVNPYQIATGQPYCFSLLDAIIDARSAASVAYRGEVYDLTGAAGVRQFRLAARTALIVKPAPQAYADALELSALLGATGAQVGEHQRPISLAELIALKDAGVRIENHGWSHVEISSLARPGVRGARHRRSGVVAARAIGAKRRCTRSRSVRPTFRPACENGSLTDTFWPATAFRAAASARGAGTARTWRRRCAARSACAPTLARGTGVSPGPAP